MSSNHALALVTPIYQLLPALNAVHLCEECVCSNSTYGTLKDCTCTNLKLSTIGKNYCPPVGHLLATTNLQILHFYGPLLSTICIKFPCLNSTYVRWELGLQAETKVVKHQLATCSYSACNRIKPMQHYLRHVMCVRSMCSQSSKLIVKPLRFALQN